MKWPTLSDIIALSPSKESLTPRFQADDFFGLGGDKGQRPERPCEPSEGERARRIRFDNAIRLWVAVPTYLTCLSLRAGGAINSIMPITLVIGLYAGALFGAFTFFFNRGFSRFSDFVLSAFDLITMSLAVYFTGATASPLYFVYFVPVVVHAFHRDWEMILFSGFGGVVLYGIAVVVSLTALTSASMTDLCARLVFMLLTVAIACLALSVLRREEVRDRLQTARLRAISLLGDRLNRSSSTDEIFRLCSEILPAVEHAVSVPVEASRIFNLRLFSHLDVPESVPDKNVQNDQITAPIGLDGDEVRALLYLRARQPFAMSDDDKVFVRFVAESIALRIRQQKTIDELRGSVEMGTAAAAVYLAAGRSPEAAYISLVTGARNLIGATAAVVYVWHGGRGRLERVAADERKGLKNCSDDEQMRVVARAFETGLVQTGTIGKASQTLSHIAAPLKLSDGTVIGVLIVQKEGNEAQLSEDEIVLVTALACRSAPALHAASPHANVPHPSLHRLAA